MKAKWDEIKVHRGDRHVATILKRGTEIHFRKESDNVSPWITPTRIRKYLGPLFDELGFLTTRSHLHESQTIGWLEQFGFEKTWADKDFQYFILAELPYQRVGARDAPGDTTST